MTKKKRQILTAQEANSLREEAGLPILTTDELEALDAELPLHFGRFLDWFKQHKNKQAEEMYCFILYDIEHNKISRILAKFLEKKGCIRVQQSVFFAKMHRKLYAEIKGIITELQECYENQDTIMMLPVGEDMLNNMHCIGKNFDCELLTQSKHTVIF